MNKKNIHFITTAGIIAAIYIVLVLFLKPISSGDIQCRIAEALTILPYFTPAAIPGLTIGCFFANYFSGNIPLDIFLGTFATFIASVFSYKLRKYKYLVGIPPVISNTIIVPFILIYGYGLKFDDIILFNKLSEMFHLPNSMFLLYIIIAFTIFVGEFISAYILGTILLKALEPYSNLFKNTNE